MKISVLTKKNNLPLLKKMAQKIQRAKSEYGYFSEQGEHPSGYSFATLMSIHENGWKNSPKRMPFRITLHNHQKEILKFTLKALDKHVMTASNAKTSPLELVLSTFGSLGVYHTRSIFGSDKLLPNKEPIRKKNPSITTSLPLIDMGDLKENMAHRNSESKEIKTK